MLDDTWHGVLNDADVDALRRVATSSTGVVRFVADGDDVVMIGHCHWRHRASGRDVRSPKIDVWHFENGKATRFYEMFDTLAFARTVGMV